MPPRKDSATAAALYRNHFWSVLLTCLPCQVAVRASLVIGGRIIQAATQQTRPMPLTVQHRKRPAPPLSGTHSGRAAPAKRKRKRKQKQRKPSFAKSTDGKEAEAEGGPKSSPSQPSVPSVASSLASPALLTPASTPSSETAEASGATTSRAVACGCCQLPRPERLTIANELSSLCIVSGWHQTAGMSCPVHRSVPLFSLPLIFFLRLFANAFFPSFVRWFVGSLVRWFVGSFLCSASLPFSGRPVATSSGGNGPSSSFF